MLDSLYPDQIALPCVQFTFHINSLTSNLYDFGTGTSFKLQYH